MKDIHILFVDDEAFTLNSLKRLLRKESYSIHYAESGAAALDIMKEILIHILVTDMKMPEMDGLTLLRHVKEKYPDTVRIALSAYTMTGQLLPCINTGEIYRFITKPIIPEELRQSIQDAIDYYLVRGSGPGMENRYAWLEPISISLIAKTLKISFTMQTNGWNSACGNVPRSWKICSLKW